MEVDTWAAIFAPPGVTNALANTLHEAIKKSLDSQEVKERFAAISQEPSVMTREELSTRIARDSAIFRTVIERSNIRME
jgi:tripartite-type tricarboxylate transporter receptor subunit TctC